MFCLTSLIKLLKDSIKGANKIESKIIKFLPLKNCPNTYKKEF